MVHVNESEMKPVPPQNPEEVIAPETRSLVEEVQAALTLLHISIGNSEAEQEVVESYYYCFRNYFTLEEMVQHMTGLGYGITEASVRDIFELFMTNIKPKEAAESYARDSRTAADLRVAEDQGSSTSEIRKGEPSTSARP